MGQQAVVTDTEHDQKPYIYQDLLRLAIGQHKSPQEGPNTKKIKKTKRPKQQKTTQYQQLEGLIFGLWDGCVNNAKINIDFFHQFFHKQYTEQ